MNAATKTAPKLAATCAYCLRPDTRLAAGSVCPIRHGWKAHGGSGGANGQEGSWHSGPCRGLSFPHLGQSTDGLVAAIADCDAWIARAEGKRAALDARPPLPYYKRDHNRKGSPVIDEVMVQPGDMSPPPVDGIGARPRVWHPEYETILASAKRNADAELAAARASVGGLRAALATWTPAEPVEVK